MIKIAHRGNLFGRIPERENSPEYIQEALDAGYDVEVDVWYEEERLFLGHVSPQYEISEELLESKNFWCHAKNPAALSKMLQNKKINCFWHQSDDYTLTSKGYIWTYPNKKILPGGIMVVFGNQNISETEDLGGICSDFVGNIEW
tara:strand:- start:9766 stop:10200 length:435 start_codon:yes stop_codon:yes gene_type:complete